MDENHNGIDAFVPPKSDVQLPDVKTVTDVLKTRDWLHGQSYDLDVALTAEKLDLLDTQDVDLLQERICSLQHELYQISADRTVKELVLEEVQYNDVLSQKMFTEPLPSVADSESGQEDTDRRKYEILLSEKSQLTSSILRKHKTVTELQKELDAVRKRNFELKKRNRGLMGVLGQHSKRLEKMAADVKNNAACRELKEELEATVSRVEIAKCTLQALIVGSGVQWAEDPELLETVLLCGDSVQL